jgi:hypothetical protein
MRYNIKQLAPWRIRSRSITATDTREALDIIATMIERGAIEVEIVDINGRRYDLIDLERIFDEEMADAGNC